MSSETGSVVLATLTEVLKEQVEKGLINEGEAKNIAAGRNPNGTKKRG